MNKNPASEEQKKQKPWVRPELVELSLRETETGTRFTGQPESTDYEPAPAS